MRTKGSKNKKEAMAHLSLFVPKDTLKYFKELADKSGVGYTSLVREVLVRWVDRRSK